MSTRKPCFHCLQYCSHIKPKISEALARACFSKTRISGNGFG
uniref:mRNA decapping complex subunit 2 n=1 Tax=Rhizophora mucronata TaxID=61149 RepID=A0A2P2KB97_RHIMU